MITCGIDIGGTFTKITLLNKENKRRLSDRTSCIEDYEALRNEISVLFEKTLHK